MDLPDLDDLATTAEACRLLGGLSARTLWNWRRRGLVEAYSIPGTRRLYFSRRQIASLLRAESEAVHAARARAQDLLRERP